jgi:putative peptidoglycan lipid II flippase
VLRLLIPNTLAVAIASTGFIVDTAFISYLPDRASLAAERSANMLYSLPLALLALAIGQAALPQLSTLAASGRYVRLRMTIVKLVGIALSLSVVASIMLYLLGKPTIRLLFQHGAFGKHSSAVTGTALLGYAFALPGLVAASLLVLSFYALKDARTPLLTNILALATRWTLIILLLRLFTGSQMILAIPLAAGGAGIVETLVLGSFLFMRLRSKVKVDKGMLRLKRRRNQQASSRTKQ